MRPKKSTWKHTEINKTNQNKFSFLKSEQILIFKPEQFENTGSAKERQSTAKHITLY